MRDHVNKLHVERMGRILVSAQGNVIAPGANTRHATIDLTSRKNVTWKNYEEEAAFIRKAKRDGIIRFPNDDVYEKRSDRPNAITEVNPRHYQTWARMPSVQHSIRDLHKEVPGADGMSLRLLCEQAHWYKLFEYYGKRVYVIDSTTFDLLMETDVPDFPADSLKFPVGAFYLAFPRGKLLDPNALSRTGHSFGDWIEGAAVSTDMMEGDGVYERCLCCQVTLRMPDSVPEEKHVAGIACTFDVPMWPDRSLVDVAAGMGYDEKPVRDSVEDVVPKIVVNFLLYLMSEQPLIEPVPRREAVKTRNAKKQRRAYRTTSVAYLYVGGRADAQGVHRGSSEEGTGRKLDHAVWVRGHWRQQSYGPQHSLRKTLWIKPHMRGPDLAESLREKTYVVQRAQKK